MRVKVKIYSVDAPARRQDATSLDIQCGSGEQLVQWLAQVACLKLAYAQRGVVRQFVPQAVLGRDNTVLDIDLVLKEVVKDGDEVFVEYSAGPRAFAARWEGRPATPPFQWGDQGVILPPHDLWLTELDLKAEGLLQLLDPETRAADPGNANKDLELVKILLTQHAGPLQACFCFYEFQGEKQAPASSRMNLTQFKAFCAAGKMLGGKFAAERLDEIFTNVATYPARLERKMDAMAASTLNLLDFIVAVVNVAYHRFAALQPDLAAHTFLSNKLDRLITECLMKHVYPEISRRIERYVQAQSTGCQMLLRKGRRLTEQTLDSCQLKRVSLAHVRVELKHLCSHLQRWNLLGRDFSFTDMAAMTLFAKHGTHEVETFKLQAHPIQIGYDEFELILLSMAFHMYTMQKKAEPFEEFLGETMDLVFRRSGVLVELPKD